MTRTAFPATTLFAAFALLLTACHKDQQGGVPLTLVDISINVNNPAYIDLAVPGGWLYLSGGTNGIIVYRTSVDQFVAMDRTCTYPSVSTCRVVVDDSDVLIRDTTCCQSAFLLINGSVTQGPATLGLKQYNTTFNGTTLRIFN